MAGKEYDRTAQDLGNIVNLGHVNVRITDQHLATNYYITGLGLTRDPFLNTGAGLMWVNVGMSQFHLSTGDPDVLRGVTGLVVPDRAALIERLAQLRKPLEGTRFAFRESNDCVETVCPWGNRIHVHAPDESRFGRIVLGMPYIAFDVRCGTAERIARSIASSWGLSRASRRTAIAAARACRWATSSIGIFARPIGQSGRMTAITCKSPSPISPHPIAGSRRARPHHHGGQRARISFQGHRRPGFARGVIHRRA
jgi:hypothetical protein